MNREVYKDEESLRQAFIVHLERRECIATDFQNLTIEVLPPHEEADK